MSRKVTPRRERSPNPTEPLEYAGERLGVGRNQTYAAARRGDIPVIRIGKSYRVLVDPFEQMLAGALIAAGTPAKPLKHPRRRRTDEDQAAT